MAADWSAEVIEAVERWIATKPERGNVRELADIGPATPHRDGWLVLDLRASRTNPDSLGEPCFAGERGPDHEPSYPVEELRNVDGVLMLREPPGLPSQRRYLWARSMSPRFLLEKLRDGLRPQAPRPWRRRWRRSGSAGTPTAGADAVGLLDAQAEAFRACLSPGVRLVWGPPGTGKTQVLARAIEELVRAGKRVLLVSTANVAVDNALHAVLPRLPQRPGVAIRVGPAHLKEIATDPNVQLERLARGRVPQVDAAARAGGRAAARDRRARRGGREPAGRARRLRRPGLPRRAARESLPSGRPRSCGPECALPRRPSRKRGARDAAARAALARARPRTWRSTRTPRAQRLPRSGRTSSLASTRSSGPPARTRRLRSPAGTRPAGGPPAAPSPRSVLTPSYAASSRRRRPAAQGLLGVADRGADDHRRHRPGRAGRGGPRVGALRRLRQPRPPRSQRAEQELDGLRKALRRCAVPRLTQRGRPAARRAVRRARPSRPATRDCRS